MGGNGPRPITPQNSTKLFAGRLDCSPNGAGMLFRFVIHWTMVDPEGITMQKERKVLELTVSAHLLFITSCYLVQAYGEKPDWC